MRQLLIGKWRHHYKMKNGNVIKGTTEYRADHSVSTYSENYSNGKKLAVSQCEGTWSIDGGILKIKTVEQGSLKTIELDVKLIKVTEDRYTYDLPGEGELFEIRIKEE